MHRFSLPALIAVLCITSASHAQEAFTKAEAPWRTPKAMASAAAVPVPSHPSLVTFTMKAAYHDCGAMPGQNHPGPRDIAGYEPKPDGKYPVFIYLTGTLMRFNGPEAKLFTSEMAKRGFVAAAVDYDNTAYPYCPTMSAKAKCIFDSKADTSALAKVCARAKADCGRGVVVAGFSQGANLAALAANVNDQVRAAFLMGHGHRAMNSIDVTRCADDSATKLTPAQMRSVNGEADLFFGNNAAGVRKQLERVVGSTCTNMLDCEGERGAGWHIVANDALADHAADHCYFFNKANVFCSEYEGLDPGWQSGSAPWSLGPNLDWLAAQIAPAPQEEPATAAAQHAGER